MPNQKPFLWRTLFPQYPMENLLAKYADANLRSTKNSVAEDAAEGLWQLIAIASETEKIWNCCWSSGFTDPDELAEVDSQSSSAQFDPEWVRNESNPQISRCLPSWAFCP